MGKVIELTVHRNTRQRRQFREVRSQLRSAANRLPAGTVGYALVTWDCNTRTKSKWDTGRTMPGDVVPEFIKRVMVRTIAMDDARDIIHPTEPDDA